MNLNLQHLRYLVEVQKYGSITKAASVLFMGQPNLSKAIKEIENEMNITIFKRSARGVVPTAKGEEFLEYAKAVLVQLDKMEALYKNSSNETISFSIGIPRASYITYAFTKFLNQLDTSKKIDVHIKESNSMDVINSIIECEYNLGIIRFDTSYQDNFISLLDEKKLKHQTLCEFNYLVLVSRDNPLANNGYVSNYELSKCIEIVHDDDFVPYVTNTFLNLNKSKNSPFYDNNKIYVCERGSQFDILTSVDNTYMWVSPLPQQLLKRYNLVQLKCIDNSINIKDVFIHPKNYKFTEYDAMFIDELKSVISKMFH
ncbi:MAG: LysR family transcriptional regulator [Oscillospiraceae bacterium]